MKFLKPFVAFISIIFPGLLFSQDAGLDEKINSAFEPIANVISSIVFYAIRINENVSIPIVLIILISGATYFTFYFNFTNIKDFFLSIRITRGKYDDLERGAITVHTEEHLIDPDGGDILKTAKKEDHIGEVNHFQALASALSATVGLGNIAGVAVAIGLGGPGATFWMILAGLLGMSSKFTECTLGVKYRDIEPDGTVHGGPMYYLTKGFAKRNLPGLGKFLAVFFAIMTVGGSFGGGNMFQANQATKQLINIFGIEAGFAGFAIGIVIAIMVGLVIIGGIKRIASVSEKIVPLMAIVYVGAGLIIVGLNYDKIGWALSTIYHGAFTTTAVAGGLIGVMVQGIKRAVFSNEAGVGSASIAHSAVKTKYPASEGLVALLEPFIDTVVICTMTAIVIIITGYYVQQPGSTAEGVAVTSMAFNSVIPHFDIVLTIAVFLFAFSTMISWSYYGITAWKYLFGRTKKMDITYKLVFLVFTVIGSSASLGAVIDFSDAMIFAMVFPNIIGLIVLAPEVKEEYKRYLAAIKAFTLKQAK